MSSTIGSIPGANIELAGKEEAGNPLEDDVPPAIVVVGSGTTAGSLAIGSRYPINQFQHCPLTW
jgi:hypothetical protein